MPTAAKKHSTISLILATTVTVLFCAVAALIIVGWTPGMTGLPADIAAMQ